MKQFSYFDLIANIIPGVVSLVSINYIIPETKILTPSGNIGIDLVILPVIAFIFGSLLQQISKYSIEPLLKLCFWHQRFYSEVYLLKQYDFCKEPLRTQILSCAKQYFHFDESELGLLDQNDLKRYVVSHQIYRKYDYYTIDHGLAIKAHTANILYSLYRGLTMTFLLIFLVLLVQCVLENHLLFCITTLFLIAAILTALRARREGELYVSGVLSTHIEVK